MCPGTMRMVVQQQGSAVCAQFAYNFLNFSEYCCVKILNVLRHIDRVHILLYTCIKSKGNE